MVVYNRYIGNIGSVPGKQGVPPAVKQNVQENSFSTVLQNKIAEQTGLKFSKHAEARLESRGIKLTQAQKDKISDAVKKAEGKGVKDTLVLMDNLAFIVNVKSRTVVTAVNSSELKENVFTNIDGAVFT